MNTPSPTSRPRARRCSDRGSAPVQLLLAAPILMTLLMLAVVGGRITAVQIDANGAAHAAARAASLEHDPASAYTAAHVTAAQSLPGRCGTPAVNADIDLEPGGRITVTVTCTVDGSDFPLLGDRTVTGRAVAPVDPWRGDPAP